MSAEGEKPKVEEVAEAVASVKLENGDAKTEQKAEAGPTFTEQFRAFSKFGDLKSDGKTITLSQSDKWMKQAKVIDGKTITTTDTGIYFKKLKSLKVSITDYNKFLEDFAKAKKVEVKDLKKKMTSCGAPGHSGASAVSVFQLYVYYNISNKFVLEMFSKRYSTTFDRHIKIHRHT